MEISLYNSKRGHRRMWVGNSWAWLAGWTIMLLASAGMSADGKAAPTDGKGQEKIQVSADRLVAKRQENMAEFIGNVHVTQGEATLLADRVTVYTKDSPKSADPTKTGAESIDRIIAAGNVEIKMRDGTAVTQQAEYQADKRILILSGPGTKVTNAGNSITGSKITLYRDDGRINVDGGDQQRVQAVFVTKGGLIE